MVTFQKAEGLLRTDSSLPVLYLLFPGIHEIMQQYFQTCTMTLYLKFPTFLKTLTSNMKLLMFGLFFPCSLHAIFASQQFILFFKVLCPFRSQDTSVCFIFRVLSYLLAGIADKKIDGCDFMLKAEQPFGHSC